MTSEGLMKMFEGDSPDMCEGKLPLMLMGGQVEGLACQAAFPPRTHVHSTQEIARITGNLDEYFQKVTGFYKIQMKFPFFLPNSMKLKQYFSI